MKGLLELIPKDLVNERELELLIGGMSEIDMCVFYLHLTLLRNTDPYTTGMIRPSSPTTAATGKPTSHRIVLNIYPCLACFAKVSSAPIQHWYLLCTRQWLQGSPGLWRSEKVCYREVWRSYGTAKKHIHGSIGTWRVSCCIFTEECCLE